MSDEYSFTLVGWSLLLRPHRLLVITPPPGAAQPISDVEIFAALASGCAAVEIRDAAGAVLERREVDP